MSAVQGADPGLNSRGTGQHIHMNTPSKQTNASDASAVYLIKRPIDVRVCCHLSGDADKTFFILCQTAGTSHIK